MFEPIPFDYPPVAPLIVVEGRIGGVPGSIVVDTGATPPFPLFISEDLARRLNLQLSAEVEVPSGTAIGPRRSTYRSATLASLDVGGIRMGPIQIAVLPMIDGMGPGLGRRVDAIVGASFLRGRTVRIDYERKQIDFAAAPGPAAGAIPFSFAPNKPVMIIDARLNGRIPVKLEVDSGASATSLTPGAARRARLRLRGGGVMTGAGGPIRVQVTSASVTFANLSRQLPLVSVSGEIDRIGREVGVPIDGILGTDFMQGRVLTIDFAARRLWLTED
jgi:predicted aspartyl protease